MNFVSWVVHSISQYVSEHLSESCPRSSEFVLTSGIRAVDRGEKPEKMPRRGETLIQSERLSTDESTKNVEVIVPTPLTQLSATNYRHMAMRMEVHLDAQGLWEAVTGTKTNR